MSCPAGCACMHGAKCSDNKFLKALEFVCDQAHADEQSMGNGGQYSSKICMQDTGCRHLLALCPARSFVCLTLGLLLPPSLLCLLLLPLRLLRILPALQHCHLSSLVLLGLQAVHSLQVAAVRLQWLCSKDASCWDLFCLSGAACQQAMPSPLEGPWSLCLLICVFSTQWALVWLGSL